MQSVINPWFISTFTGTAALSMVVAIASLHR
jgi:hypothetical protein